MVPTPPACSNPLAIRSRSDQAMAKAFGKPRGPSPAPGGMQGGQAGRLRDGRQPEKVRAALHTGAARCGYQKAPWRYGTGQGRAGTEGLGRHKGVL